MSVTINLMSHSNASFSEWLEQRFLDWERESGGRRSLTKFAEYLGVKRPTLSQWMNDKRIPRDKETVDRLAYILGNEVYEYLDVDESDPELLRIKSIWDKISPRTKAYIMSLVDEDAGRESKVGENNQRTART